MSLFNRDQREYMQSLASIPSEEKCWCGWYKLGECSDCPPDKTNADKVAASCPSCKGSPRHDGTGPIIHTIWCDREKKEREEDKQ